MAVYCHQPAHLRSCFARRLCRVEVTRTDAIGSFALAKTIRVQYESFFTGSLWMNVALVCSASMLL